MALSIIGTPTCVAATSVTLPTHASGDWIGFFAYKDGATSIPTVPSAGGTVPTWTTIDGPTGANSNASVLCWALASSSSHTSGTWTGATGVGCIVLRGQHATPIGAHATGGSAANGANIPIVTMTPTVTDGTAYYIGFAGYRTVTAWGSPDSGYTTQASVSTECIIVTKNTTTSDGTYNVGTTESGNGGYRTHQVEVIAAAGGGGGGGGAGSSFFRVF